MNRRAALIAAAATLAGTALAKVPLRAETYEEYCVRRMRQVIVDAHGPQAFDRYRDYTEPLARHFAQTPGQSRPVERERLARVEKAWVDLVARFEENRMNRVGGL